MRSFGRWMREEIMIKTRRLREGTVDSMVVKGPQEW